MPMPRYVREKLWILPVIVTIAISGCSSNSDDKSQDTGAVRKKIVMTSKPGENAQPASAPAQGVTETNPAPDAKAKIESPAVPGGSVAPSPQMSEGQAVSPVAPPPIQSDEKSVPGEAAASTGSAHATIAASSQSAYMIDNKIDPFVPLFKDEVRQTAPEHASAESKNAARTPQSPLETMELEQLKLTGIVSTQHVKKALVEEASGKGYVIEIGTYIGRNGGRVTQIVDDRVIVQEENTDVLGKKNVRERELKLLHGEGGTPHE
jgi:Tfp pilus assembly protein PilP